MKWALLFTLSLGGPPQTVQSDRWFALDKWKHFAASAVLQGVAYGVASGKQGHSASLRIGAGTVAVVGLGRELYDWRTKKHFSKKDLVWDAFGGGAAALALHTVR